MGSKTLEGQPRYDEASTTQPPANGGKPRGCSLGQDGDGDMGNGDDDDADDDNEDPALSAVNVNGPATEKKKRRKNNKKKSNKKGAVTGQTNPPRVPLSTLFPSEIYPPGEFMEYTNGVDENLHRTTGEETRYLTRLQMHDEKFLNDYRKGAEVHRSVRQWVQQTVKPGHTLQEVAEGIEDGVRALLGNQGLEPGDCLKSGMGFPTGLALNSCVAHWTPNPGGKDVVLKQEDVMKVDFGVHINGWIVDSAFTMSFDPVYDNLLEAVRDATNTGIKCAGVDARMGEIGGAIQEAMESYEVEIKGKTHRVKAVRNITGHNIDQYCIHAGKSIPFIKTNDQTKMEEGEVFAVETFGTTGRGYLSDGPGVYGYGRDPNASASQLKLASARSLLKTIDRNFGNIVFCRRYMDRIGLDKYLLGLNSLVSNGILDMHAPLNDIEGSYSAQFEHTLLIGSSGKEILSRGDDY